MGLLVLKRVKENIQFRSPCCSNISLVLEKRFREAIIFYIAMTVLQFCLLTFFVVGTKSTYIISNKIVIDGGNYNVLYTYDAYADKLFF